MSEIYEFEYGNEIRGVVCPACGGSLVWVKGRAYCDQDGFVEPVTEELSPYSELSEEDRRWLEENLKGNDIE